MKNELDYFYIEKTFGGNQEWFRDPWMHIGGCAAAAACDSCIAIEKAGIKQNLCPSPTENLTKCQYVNFAMKMKPYLKPRWSGIDRLEIYLEGMGKYLKDIGNTDLCIEAFPGDRPTQEAKEAVKTQIDKGFPVPFLLLKHKDKKLKDFFWHWFMLVGYEDFENDIYVKWATYGEYDWISFENLWNSGFEENGGMILYG